MVQRRRNSHVEGLATHDGPESCGRARKGVPEALTGVHAGRVLSREIEFNFQVPRLFLKSKATPATSIGETERDLARSTMRPRACVEAPCARTGRPCAPLMADGAMGRDGKSKDTSHRWTGQGV